MICPLMHRYSSKTPPPPPPPNARNFMLLLEDLRMDTYEGRFGCVVGGAGIGKSRVVKYFHTNAQETVYIESTNTWKTSSLSFLKDVCRELDIESPKGNRDWCFRAIVETLYDNPETIILVDEADRLGNEGLEFARDNHSHHLVSHYIDRRDAPFGHDAEKRAGMDAHLCTGSVCAHEGVRRDHLCPGSRRRQPVRRSRPHPASDKNPENGQR